MFCQPHVLGAFENSEMCEGKADQEQQCVNQPKRHGILPVVPTAAFIQMMIPATLGTVAQEYHRSPKACHDVLVSSAIFNFSIAIVSKWKAEGYINATFSGWWFGTFFIFPYIGNNHPN